MRGKYARRAAAQLRRHGPNLVLAIVAPEPTPAPRPPWWRRLLAWLDAVSSAWLGVP